MAVASTSAQIILRAFGMSFKVDCRDHDVAAVTGAACTWRTSCVTPRQHVHLPRQLPHLPHALHRTLSRMKLLRKPSCHVNLSSDEPRLDQDVAVYAAAASVLDAWRGIWGARTCRIVDGKV
jgi:hypothetical protein